MDKEKLFAARKKLKQYQLYKKDNIHRYEVKECKNDENVTDSRKGTQKYSNRFNNSHFKTESSENSSHSFAEDANNDMKTDMKNENYSTPMIENVSNIVSTDDFTNNTNSTKDDFQLNQSTVLEENELSSQHSNLCNLTVFSECNDSVNDSNSNASLQEINSDRKDSSHTLYNSSFLQKEHLLQMASSVAEVLVNVNDFNETSTMNNLIDKNQFLTKCLQEQANLISELHGQVCRYSSKISELEALIAANNAECTGKIMQEINPLKQQVQLHTHTTGILVAEKAELKATVDKCYATIKQKTEIIEDISRQLKSCQLEVVGFQKESDYYKNINEEINKSYQLLQQSYEKTLVDCSTLRKEKEGLEFECSELKQKLTLNNTKLTTAQQELQEKQAMLSLNEIKMQQLITSSDQAQNLENDRQTALVYEQQLTQLKDTLSALNYEKDEANKQYKCYLEQSDERLKLVKIELHKCHKHIEELESEEENYIKRLLKMEHQLQHERDQIESFKPLLEDKEKVEMLTRNIDNLVMEQESLQVALNRKDAEIEALNKELQELPEIKDNNIDATALVTALESEQLGASRAVSQNQQLKQQLDEMHDAFVLLSNNKLDLTEQLQSERNLCKQLNSKLVEYESTVQDLKRELSEKEAALHKPKREKLQSVNPIFQASKYESSESKTWLQELQNAKASIENFQKENYLLRNQLKIQSKQMEIENEEDIQSDVKYHGVNTTAHRNSSNQCAIIGIQTNDINSIAPESIKKLEGRFKETMDKVAELTDEKQRLEHLVLQLQEETETIGEYVTLYQKQRFILQERAKEREETFRHISEQRNYQQAQLHKLEFLVAKILKIEPTALKDAIDAIKNPQSFCHSTEYLEELRRCSSLNEDILPADVEDKVNLTREDEFQIHDLLSEIKDCSGTCIREPNFHPCPLCSGKLITI